jgi:heme oxygenase
MHATGQPDIAPESLSAMLRHATADLHMRAERSGIVQTIMRGRATRARYALFLRNLLPAYAALEAGLLAKRDRPGVRRVALPELFRTDAIISDLAALSGDGWEAELALLPSGAAYASQVARATEGDGAGLIGHAYARYLGDLSGAQFMKRSLMRSLGLEREMLGFYDFPAIPDVDAFKSAYRAALDDAAGEIGDTTIVVAAAQQAFACNIAISEAVDAC